MKLHEKFLRRIENGEPIYDNVKFAEDLEAIANNHSEQLHITDVISRFSGQKLMKLQKHFVEMYGSDEMAKEKANSFAVGFGKACELMCKDLSNGL